ncbi:MAG: Na+/proline symporter, partial [Cyclobacteriaceae bacterium]
MGPGLVASIIGGYFLLLLGISYLTSKKNSNDAFFTGDRSSPWYLVAFGMIGASLSGVTFISVPGEVGNSYWYYFQIVLGYLAGYMVIAKLLLPLYYKLQLVSIYTYLERRLGTISYKTGAFFFLLSRVIGASFRLFLVSGVLQIAFFEPMGLPFWIAVLTAIVLIWLYTYRGGIKTIVWTDTLQTAFMLLSVVVSIYFIKDELAWSWMDVSKNVLDDARSQVFNWEWNHPRNFFKQFFAGAFIAIVMTGLDQDMMQKNLTCRTLKDAQKNMYWFSGTLILVNLLFLILGVMLYQFAEIQQLSIPERSDNLFPFLAVNHFSTIGGVVFLLGITAAAYSSADSALTALTTSFCIDFLGFKTENFDKKIRLRKTV